MSTLMKIVVVLLVAGAIAGGSCYACGDGCNDEDTVHHIDH